MDNTNFENIVTQFWVWRLNEFNGRAFNFKSQFVHRVACYPGWEVEKNKKRITLMYHRDHTQLLLDFFSLYVFPKYPAAVLEQLELPKHFTWFIFNDGLGSWKESDKFIPKAELCVNKFGISPMVLVDLFTQIGCQLILLEQDIKFRGEE